MYLKKVLHSLPIYEVFKNNPMKSSFFLSFFTQKTAIDKLFKSYLNLQNDDNSDVFFILSKTRKCFSLLKEKYLNPDFLFFMF